MDSQTPFMFKGGEGVNAGQGEVEWYKYDELFDSLNPVDGKVTGALAKGESGRAPTYCIRYLQRNK